MSLTLYYDKANPESRSVLLVCRATNIVPDLREVDSYKGGLDEELLQINPQNTTPILKDGDLVIWENHAIVTYLINKYRSDDPLYPADPRRRSLIDEILYFDASVLLSRINNVLNSIIVNDEKEISIDKIYDLQEAYAYLEKLLDKTEYLAGEELTLADLCCVASVSSATIITPLSSSKYPKLFRWFSKCKKLVYYSEANGPGLEKLDALVENKFGCVNSKKST